jgi:Cd2+/Zn2+-exporting ATPase
MDVRVGELRWRVDGMDCGSCAAKVENAVARLDGVAEATVSLATGSLKVTPRDAGPSPAAVEAIVTRLGYTIRPAETPAAAKPACDCCHHDHDHAAHDHDHAGHDHAGHDHAAHDHGGHDHAAHTDHDHAGHDHGHAGRDHDHAADAAMPFWQRRPVRLAAIAAIAMALAYAVGLLAPSLARPAFVVAVLIGIAPIARVAWAAATSGTPFSIESLLVIAAIGALFIGAEEEAAAVVVLFLIGEVLEGVAAGRARAGIQALAKLVPDTALLERDGATTTVAAATLKVGDTIRIRPGDRVAADGTILAGDSALDESTVTGESIPVAKGPGAAVYAGTVNGPAVLTVRVTAAANDNTVARIIRLVTEAQETKAPVERFINRFARYYTPAVAATGFLVAVVPPLVFGGAWSEWIYKGLATLLIGCPCALVISTPAAIASALAAGARQGLLLKGGAVLETVGRVTAVAFDKTGTLTEGRPEVTEIVPLAAGEAEIIRLAAALEAGSSHPLARAVLARAGATPLPAVEGSRAESGRGVNGRVEGHDIFFGAAAGLDLKPEGDAAIARLTAGGATVCVLTIDGVPAGIVAFRDAPRPDAAAALAALKRQGIRTVMLTGDNARAAASVAAELGIEPRAELKPADKSRIIAELKREGMVVAKVGDGINDAPALAAADVGIAMAGGADVALEAADAAILHGRVGDVGAMIALSRRTLANIRQNITIALGLKGVFLVTTLAGITGLWPAILADTGATVIVTANALRLLAAGRPKA